MIKSLCTLVLKIKFKQLLLKMLPEGGFGLSVIMFLNIGVISDELGCFVW